ncbi:MAG: hypothetical protein ACI379_01145 [Nocardioides sp.]|uniref:hypothetical protein n=1 Tax=Nocardioides sp. TaxID=35761 RepID=UPI003EFF77BD
MQERFDDAALAIFVRLTIGVRDERGDVPGWVMVTVMSAAVVAVLIPMAKDQLGDMMDNAMAMVTGSAAE